jgi:hypothetical protein
LPAIDERQWEDGAPGRAQCVDVRRHTATQLAQIVEAVELTLDTERVQHVERRGRQSA